MTHASILSGSLRTLFGVGTLSGLTDGQLLERFLRGRRGAGEAASEAEAAFTVLVERHGPMVLNVCRAVLGDRHDAEDACQATFLVLARRAEWIRRGDSVASWLYGVARRIAARARRDAARRRALERRRLERIGSAEPTSAPPAEPWPELYEELDRLPEPFRAAVVLCDLEGHSYEQAAGLLSCPVGTIQSRLARGRRRLRHRLERRGIAPAVAMVGLGTELAARPAAALSPPLTAAIARAALAIGAGRTIAGAAPAAVAALAGAEVRRQVMKRLATILTTLLVAGLMATAAIGLAAGGQSGEPQAPLATGAVELAIGPIHVRVVDLDGKAAEDVPVEVRGWSQPSPSFTTDADGRVTIPREMLGERETLIARRGRDALAWYPSLDTDDRTNRPAGTEDDPIVMKLLPLDHQLESSVADEAGRRIPGVEIAVSFLHHPINGMVSGSLGRSAIIEPAKVDGAGRFVVKLPREATGGLKAVHPRFAIRPVVVHPTDRNVLPQTLKPAGGIIGRVTDAVTGRPVAGAVLSAQLVEARAQGLSGWGEAMSDDQGRFSIHGLEAGVYNVLLEEVPGRINATARAVEGVRVRASADAPADLTVIEGRAVRGIAVDRDTGQPVPGIRVGCYGPARPRSGDSWARTKTDDRGRFTFHVPHGEQYICLQDGDSNHRLAHRTVVVPDQGKVELVRLMRRAPRDQGMMGMMKVAAPDVGKAAGAPPDPTKVEDAEAVEVAVLPVEPAAGKAEVTVEQYTKAVGPAPAKAADRANGPAAARRFRAVTGHVRDPQGRPLAGVRLQATSPAGPPTPDLPVTDREGMFVFPRLPREPLMISLHRPGYRSQTQELPADREEVEWTFDLIPDSEARNQPGPPTDEPIPPDLRDRLIFVDLQSLGTDYLTDGPGESGNDLNRLPRGVHRLGETYFRIGEKMVHVQGRMRSDLPQAVKGIEVRARGRVLHFLHATQYGVESSDLIGAYAIHYADGTSERIPLVCGRQLADWWGFDDPSKRQATAAKVAWIGSNDTTEMNRGLKIRLFDLAWTNPHPEREIVALDMLSAGKDSDPRLSIVLIAVTLGP
jgi:RNA polymerase sigma factor (sigma-70 family)